MDIRLVVKKVILQILLSVIFLAFILGSIFAVASLLAKRIPDLKLVFTGAIAMAVALLFYNPLNKFLERIANKYFFTSLYNYQATLEGLATQLTAVIEIHKVIDLIVDTIMMSMGLDRTAVLLLSPEKNSNNYIIAKVIGFNEQNGISLVRDNFLIQWLISNRKPVVYEELGRIIEDTNSNTEKSELMRLKANMKRIEASLCLPLLAKDKLISIIVLGNKVTKDAYTVEDIRLLQTISNQASIAIENARLYQQVQDFNKNLQTKVSEQTYDIKEKSLRLEKLLQIRSEFLDIASHQLRTPVSLIRGVLSMIRDGDLQKLPLNDQKQFIENAWQKGAKLDTIINDILAASELDTQKFGVDYKTPKIQLEDVIDQVVKGFQLEAQERGTKLKWQKPTKLLPKVMGHANFLEQAISNLIGNALKYTPSTKMAKEARAKREKKGVVEVIVSQEKNNVIVKVSDNGIGIPKEEIKKLFDKFVRASNATAMYTDGSGLGLFIVREIINGHKGKVWVESELNKGSTFYIGLPITEN
ncbi:MAG: GAF domain-containing sensor histidine kinase [Patescibacteria group bacterium]